MHTHSRLTRALAIMTTSVTCALIVAGCSENLSPTETPFSPARTVSASEPATFIAVDFPGATFTSPSGINPKGEIVGQYIDAANLRHGFLRYPNGEYHSIDYPGSERSTAGGINATSDVTGSGSEGSRDHAFRLRNATFSSFQFTIGSTVAHSTFGFGINPSGDIVGEYKLVAQPFGVPGHAFLHADGTFTHISPPGATAAVAWAINPSGSSVGYYQDNQVPAVTHGWLRDVSGAYTVIDYPGATFTNARGISPSGAIVGLYRDTNGQTHGFVLAAGVFTSIDFPGATFTRLLGINARGDIVGDYRDATNRQHGFLLTR